MVGGEPGSGRLWMRSPIENVGRLLDEKMNFQGVWSTVGELFVMAMSAGTRVGGDDWVVELYLSNR